MIVFRAQENVQDALGDVVETPFVNIGSFPARMDNLSGNQTNYLERNTVEDFERVFTEKGADVQELDVIRLTEKDGTVIQTFSVRRIVTPERVRKRHHIELDVVGYDVDFTAQEVTFGEGFEYEFNFSFSS